MQNLRQRKGAGIPPHSCTVRGVVDLDCLQPGQLGQVLFIEPDACGTGDALQHQRGFT